MAVDLVPSGIENLLLCSPLTALDSSPSKWQQLGIAAAVALLGREETFEAESCSSCRTIRLTSHSLEELEQVALTVQEVLAGTRAPASSSSAPPPYDVAPGDSSDEEGGSREGIRLRVRLTRTAAEKWGFKWHKTIFQKSQRLVIDEIVDGSLMAKWNECQPEALQVRYGDRLERINGVGNRDHTAETASAKMRAELQREVMRALFFRPGSMPETSTKVEGAFPVRSVVLVTQRLCTGAAAAAVVLHVLGKDVWRELSEVAAASLKSEGAEGLLAVVNKLAAGKEDPAPAEVEEEGQEHLEVEAESPASAATEVRNPVSTYFCRKCGAALFHDVNVLPHNRDGLPRANRNWVTEDPLPGGGAQAITTCTSVFVEPMEWMGDLEGQTGRLSCGNPSCKQKLGGFSWHGLPCSCGQWQSPAFQIHLARVDCLPVGRRLRGPAPKAAFEQ